MRKSSLVLLFLLILSLLSLLGIIIFYPQRTVQKTEVNLYGLGEVPVLKNSSLSYDDLQLTTFASYAIDLSSMTILYEKNSQEIGYPASTSKMMTALVALDTFGLDDELTVGKEATVSGNKLNFKEGEKIKLKDLLAALLIYSANDSAYIIANNDPQSFDYFLGKMNQRAQNLGLEKTHFVNPAGLDEEGQKTTARDLTIIAQELLKDNYLKELVATPYEKIEGDGWSYDFYNSNQLLGQIQGVKGVKTGTTDLAGEVLVTLIERDGHQILIALMNSQDRYQDTSKLIAWILNNYEWKKL